MASPTFKSVWKATVDGSFLPSASQDELANLVKAVCEEVRDPNIRGHTWFRASFERDSFSVEKRTEPSPETLQFMCKAPDGTSHEEKLEGHYLMAMDFVWDEAQVVRRLKFFVPRQAVDETMPCAGCPARGGPEKEQGGAPAKEQGGAREG